MKWIGIAPFGIGGLMCDATERHWNRWEEEAKANKKGCVSASPGKAEKPTR
jgi:hypothetical protein